MSSILIDSTKENVSQLEFFTNFVETLGIKINWVERISSDSLSKSKLMIITGKSYEKYSREELSILLKHIKAGHRLLVFVDSDSVPFFDSTYSILKEAGIYALSSKVTCNGDPLITTKNINKNHAVTMGINEITLYNSIRFILEQKRATPIDILVRSEKNHQPPNAILACSSKYGNGKIIAVSSWSMLQPHLFRKSDNALFVSSAIYWLLDMRPPQYLMEIINEIVKS